MVLGGGDTGTDCVGTSMRQGCKSLAQLEILPKPPKDRAKDNPWPEWPKIYSMDYGQEEAAAKFGGDPRCTDHGDEIYRRRARPREGSPHHPDRVDQRMRRASLCRRKSRARKKCGRRNWCCWRWVFSGRSSRCWNNSAWSGTGVPTRRRNIGKYHTNLKGIFAAGDARRGQSLVVWAFNEGRGAARECDRYLMGRTDLP